MLKVRTISRGDNPISISLACQHLRLGAGTPADIELIRSKLQAATDYAENFTNRYIVPRRLEFLGMTNSKGVMKLPDGVSNVIVTEGLGDRMWAFNEFYNCICVEGGEGLTLKVRADVGAKDSCEVPPSVQNAILLILGTLYENEADEIVGRTVSNLTLSADKLLKPYRIDPY